MSGSSDNSMIAYTLKQTKKGVERHPDHGGDIINTSKEINHSGAINKEATTEKAPPSAEEETEAEVQSKYPHGFILVGLTIALMIAVFMVALDTNIIGTAIPKITSQFNSLNAVGWYGSAYLLTLMSLQPVYGRLYTYFNIKWVFMGALLIFEIGSTICAAAPSSPVFVVGRAISGVGAAGIFSGSLTIGRYMVPLRQRPVYMSIVTSVYGVASLAGPLLGGVLTDSQKLTWRFCFWLNLPFGGLAIFIIAIMLTTPPQQHSSLSIAEKMRKMNMEDAFLLISGTVCLLLALQWGGIIYAWSNSKVWGCLLGFGILISLFILLQVRRQDDGIIPLRIITQRSVIAGCLFTCFVNMTIDTHIYYLPFYFQAVKGTNAAGSGIRVLPYFISVTLTTVISGSCITALGFYVPFMWLGSSLLTVGSGLLHTLGTDSSTSRWIGYQLLTGIGFGMAFQIPYSATQVVLSTHDLPSGNAVIVFSQALGGALAVSIAQNILSSSLMQHLNSVPGINPRAIFVLGAANIRAEVPPQLIKAVIEAYSYALSRVYIIPIAGAGTAFLCSLAMEWRSVKKNKQEGAEDGAG